jgi:ABC-type lipoprotein export system ATPase subunit
MTALEVSTDAIVQVRDVFVAFRGAAGAVMALRGADLSVAAGERLLVQGPNGSGKSTLLRVITGEQPVVAGTVEVGGTALHRLSAVQRRRWRSQAVGFIDQHARRALLPEQTALENTALQLRLSGVPGRQARHTARATLERLGLDHLAERPVPELSGGEAQQVAICAAVAHGPRLILADEPTAELDEASARRVYDMLAQLAREGTSLIQVSHDPRSAAFADRVVAIRDGRLAEQWMHGSEVEQVPDSRGWIRIPPELLPPATRLPGLIATTGQDGLLLRPGTVGPQAWPGALTRPRPAASVEPSVTASDDGPRLELIRVAAAYPGHPLFSDLELSLRGGELVAVIGPSGSGKSTLLSLASGLLDPVAGRVLVAGDDWAGRNRTERAQLRRDRLTLAPQRPILVEPMTVRENLMITAEIRGHPLADSDLARIADELGLTALLDQPVDRLSGGERQRTTLARCLASSAPLLLLDEPTSQQDEASAIRVIDVLQAQARAGCAVLAASHDSRLIDPAARVIRLG